MRPWLILAGLNGLVAVAAGAYGWHWLETHESAQRDIFNLGVQYHMWHALALVGVAWLADRMGGRLPAVAGILFTAGLVLFSGSLYAFGLTGVLPLRGAAPAGGFLLMAGWACLVVAGVRGAGRR
ncbi:MAG: DUF423 domain-containing protein [Hyphomicrobiales bacterium]|nr:DUF423 domain-containing protein [Hyphomicrobiales bacterium]MCP5374140.1 DUF423 domain-containing protein [Hyphomicrobiales bacterium]